MDIETMNKKNYKWIIHEQNMYKTEKKMCTQINLQQT